MSTDLEMNEVKNLEAKLKAVQPKNFVKNEYYYQKNKVKVLSISNELRYRDLQSALGWAAMCIDVILEKIDWKGFYNPDPSNEESALVTEWLNSIHRDNFFDSEQSYAHKDAFITGTSFISVGKGVEDNGEPEVIWIAENSSSMTADFNRRNRSVRSAFKLYKGENGEEDKGVLWLPDATIEVAKSGDSWVEVKRDDHELGLVGVVPIFNNADSKQIYGRSDITASLMGLIDFGQRILKDSEVNRDALSSPIRSIAGLSDEDLKGMQQNGGAELNFKKGDLLYLPTNMVDNPAGPIVPTIQQLPANDPNQVLNMIEPIARLAAREMGVPPSYLGFDSVNPTSADAINAAESALIKRADDRVRQLKRTYKKLGTVTLAIAGREKPESWNEIDSVFKNTQVVTPTGSSDRLAKNAAVGLYEKEYPDFVYRELGMSNSEIVELKALVRKNSNTNIINRLTEGE